MNYEFLFRFHCSLIKKVSSYIARHPVLRTAQSALHFTPGRPVHSKAITTSLEAFSHAVITARNVFVHISTTACIARYSFIQPSELWQRGVIKLAKGSVCYRAPHCFSLVFVVVE